MSFHVQRFQPLHFPPPPPVPALPPLLPPPFAPVQQPPPPTPVQSKPTTHPLHTEIAYEKRIAIIAFRLILGLTFSAIGEKLDLRPRSAHQIFCRAQQRTREDLRNSFQDVAKNVKDAPRSGRPAIHPPGYKRIRSKKKKAPVITAPAPATTTAVAGTAAGAGTDTGGSATMGPEGERVIENGAAIIPQGQDGGVTERAGINGPAESNNGPVGMKRPTVMDGASGTNGPADMTGAKSMNTAAGLQGTFYPTTDPSRRGGVGVTQ